MILNPNTYQIHRGPQHSAICTVCPSGLDPFYRLRGHTIYMDTAVVFSLVSVFICVKNVDLIIK